MLAPFRRHNAACIEKSAKAGQPKPSRRDNRCKCPIWMDGFLEGKRVLQSLKTRNWAKAQTICRDWELDGHKPAPIAKPPEPVLEVALRFEAELMARKLTNSTQKKYRSLFRQLSQFCKATGIRELRQFTLTFTEQFRQTWKDSAISSCKKLERLRAFMKWAKAHDYIAENYAASLVQPVQKQPPTMPYTVDEVRSILKACDKYGSQDLRTLCLLMRYSGLRIGDAASLNVNRLIGHKLILYTAKTGVPVYVKLPEFVVEELSKTERHSDTHWFWTGEGKKETLAGNWRRTFRKVMAMADPKIKGAHPHRFRDTFAVELLQAGVPIEEVSAMLGHASVKVTQKSYAPWVKGRQERLEANMDRALGQDALVNELESRSRGRYKNDTRLKVVGRN